MSWFLHHSGDVASTGSVAVRTPKQDGLRFDSLRLQVRGEQVFGEFLFRLSLHRDGETDHGRPPRRFFCQSSPGVKLSSSHSR